MFWYRPEEPDHPVWQPPPDPHTNRLFGTVFALLGIGSSVATVLIIRESGFGIGPLTYALISVSMLVGSFCLFKGNYMAFFQLLSPFLLLYGFTIAPGAVVKLVMMLAMDPTQFDSSSALLASGGILAQLLFLGFGSFLVYISIKLMRGKLGD